MLLSASHSDLRLAPTEDLPDVWAALMEWQQAGTRISLAVVADGAASLYIGAGGGIIGGGEHERVRAASLRYLKLIQDVLDLFVPEGAPLPVLPGSVAFVIRTYDGLRVARDTEDRLTAKTSPAWPVFYAAHEVIAELRTVSTGVQRGSPQ
jgi:hypothetical protein